MKGLNLHGRYRILVFPAPGRGLAQIAFGVDPAHRGRQQHVRIQGVVGAEHLVFQGGSLAHHLHVHFGQGAGIEHGQYNREGDGDRSAFHRFSPMLMFPF